MCVTYLCWRGFQWSTLTLFWELVSEPHSPCFGSSSEDHLTGSLVVFPSPSPPNFTRIDISEDCAPLALVNCFQNRKNNSCLEGRLVLQTSVEQLGLVGTEELPLDQEWPKYNNSHYFPKESCI